MVDDVRLQRVESRLSQNETLVQRAFDKIDGHEKICAERMETINNTQAAIQATLASMQTTINHLSNGAFEAKGMWKAIGIISVAVGILYTIMKITGNAG